MPALANMRMTCGNDGALGDSVRPIALKRFLPFKFNWAGTSSLPEYLIGTSSKCALNDR